MTQLPLANPTSFDNLSAMTAQITKRSINSALKRAGLPVIIENNRDGYSYFTSTETGSQVGESVCLAYLNQQSIDGWVEDARYAIAQQTNN